MKTPSFFALLLPFVFAGSAMVRAGEAQVSLYVVDRSPEHAESGGVCLPYTPAEKAGSQCDVLAIAQGSAGSTLLIIAFDGDILHRDLAPVLSEQTGDSKPVRFPDGEASWTHSGATRPVELYVAVFDNADPNLARIAESVEWLSEALEEKAETEILLHAGTVKKRLSNLLRQKSAAEYQAKFGEGDAPRVAPASKAAVTRGQTEGSLLFGPDKRDPKATVAAVRRSFKTLDDEWREDSRAIAFDRSSPGVLVFPVTPPPAP